MRRLLQRRRRRWAGLTFALFAAVAVALVAGLVPALQPASPDRPYPPLPAWTRALLDSPTRGSLAGDVDLLRDVLNKAAATAPDGMDSVKVLFLGEVENRLFVAFVRYDATSAALYRNDTPVDDSVEHLGRRGPRRPARAARHHHQHRGAGRHRARAAACTIAGSIGGAVNETDNVERKWLDVPGGSWVVRTSQDLPQRWQVTCDGQGPL